MMPKTVRAAAVLVLAVCLLASAAAATMHTEVTHPALEMAADVGYDGLITYGKAFPLRVTVRNSGEDFEGSLGVNAYATAKQYDRYEIPVSLPAGSEREYVLTPAVYVGQEIFTAEITKDGETVCAVNVRPERVANPSAMLIGILSNRPQNMNNLVINRENDVLGRFELWETVALTAENFPDDPRLMNSFGMIVTDDIDPAVMTAKQQETLKNWLEGGRILLCGGGAAGARAIAYFSGDTGLSFSGIASSNDVAAALQRSTGRAVTGERISVTVANITGGEPIIRDAEDRGLVWRNAAGNGRIYTTAFESADPALNATELMHWFWQQTLINHDAELYSTALYSGSTNQEEAAVFASWSAPVRARTGMPAGLIIAAGVPVLAALCWLILKKTGRQKWMWLALPLLSAAAAACLALLGGTSEANRPMAVITENMMQATGGKNRSIRGIAAATPDFGRHSYGMQGESLHVQTYDYVDFDEEDTTRKPEPTILRTCYIAGGENRLTVESTMPWQVVNLTCEAESSIQGRIEGTAWMEQDGVHAEILNGTEYRMRNGYVILNSGHVSVPDLDPGEKAEVALIRNKLADPQHPKYENGSLYTDEPADLYTMICAALNFTETYDTNSERNPDSARASMISNAANRMYREKNGGNYSFPESSMFIYTAEPEGLPETGLSVDGQAVGRMNVFGRLTAEMNWAEIGRTGVVYHPPGMDIPVRVETDDRGMPGKDTKTSFQKVYYYALSEVPTFRFSLGMPEGVKIEKLQLRMENYYSSQTTPYALNASTGEWDKIGMNEDIATPGNYVDREGNLYLQFRPDTQEMYAEIPMPMISVEGRDEHAAD